MSFVRKRLRLVAAAISVIVPVAGLVLAQPASAAPGGQARPAAATAPAVSPPAAAAPAAAGGLVPTRRACPVPSKPGVAACDAIIRTDVAASRQGVLAAGVAPQGYGPADVQGAYKLPSATAGAGRTVAIVDAYDDPNAAADLAVYRARYGLPACTTANGCFRKVDQRGGTAYPAHDAGWATEISLDLDMVSAACPKCRILLVEADSATTSDLGAAVNEAVAQGAKYVSNSYSGQDTGTAEAQQDAQYYNHPGVVVTASAGDNGITPGGQFPADSPHVVAVGGTSLMRDPSSPRGWTETTWSGTGSGCGQSFAAPSWQQGTITACSGVKRAYSDVSAVADPVTGVAVYDSYGVTGWSVLGGTSAASPLIAATYALAGDPAGGTYPAADLYAAGGHSSLNDITTGGNDLGGTCFGPVCTAGPGWDGPTGWGTPVGVADFTAGPHGTVTGRVTDAATGDPVAGAQVMVGNATAITDRAGRYATTVLDGSYTPGASLFGYAAKTAAAVTVTTGGTVRQDFTLAKLPLATVTGTVHDASGQGWPLYAEVTVPGTPVVAYTDPATGRYSLTVPAGPAYTLHASAQFPGYLASDTPVTPGPGGLRQDIGLAADTSNCPAGYQTTHNGYSQGFDSGTMPTGWSVTNFSGPPDWQFNDPGNWGNHTGGSGGFALLDGIKGTGSVNPYHGGGEGLDDVLGTPSIDLSSAKAPVLRFSQDLIFGGPNSRVEINVNTNGGAGAWTTVYQQGGGQSVPGPDTMTIPLPQAAAGKSQVSVHFTGFNMSAYSLWELDNVFVGDLGCQPVSGGLVTGVVRDKNTGQPVDGATVSGGGQQAATSPEPGDAAVGGGLYELPVPAGTVPLSASAAGYSGGSASVSVGAGAVTRADLTLGAGRVSVSPAAVGVSARMGGAVRTAAVKVTNTGTAPVTISPSTQAGQVTVAGAGPAPERAGAAAGQVTVAGAGPAPERAGAAAGPGALAGPGAPLQRRAGHYSPGSIVARSRAAARQHPSAGQRQAAAVPAAGSWVPPWAPVAHYPDYGYGFAAATDPATGKVYAAGGITSLGVTAAGYVYDPAKQAWSQLPDMPYTRTLASAAVIGGKLYVTGGVDGNDGPILPYPGEVQPALSVYDPGTGRWTEGAPVPHAYWGAGTAVLDGKLYVVGGCTFDASGNSLCNTTDVQVYDPATDTWSQAAAYPRPISLLGCGAISGKLYCAGGFDHNLQTGTSAAYAYDPATNSWSPVASMPVDSGLWGGASAAASGQLLMSGGVTRDDQILTNQGFSYDPATGSWSPLPNAPVASYEGGSACGFYSIGGIDASGNFLSGVSQLPGYTGCDGGAGAGWLSASPGQVTLAPGQSATLTLTVSPAIAQVPQPGTYTAAVSLGSDAPYLAPQVPVTLTAAPPASWGEVTGVISGRGCTGTTAPLSGATVQLNGTASGWTLTTGPGGRYGIWLPASDGPLTVIATAGGWLAGTGTATLKAGAVTRANITLTRASCA